MASCSTSGAVRACIEQEPLKRQYRVAALKPKLWVVHVRTKIYALPEGLSDCAFRFAALQNDAVSAELEQPILVAELVRAGSTGVCRDFGPTRTQATPFVRRSVFKSAKVFLVPFEGCSSLVALFALRTEKASWEKTEPFSIQITATRPGASPAFTVRTETFEVASKVKPLKEEHYLKAVVETGRAEQIENATNPTKYRVIAPDAVEAVLRREKSVLDAASKAAAISPTSPGSGRDAEEPPLALARKASSKRKAEPNSNCDEGFPKRRRATPACDDGIVGTDALGGEQGILEPALPDLPIGQASEVSSEIFPPCLEPYDLDAMSHRSGFPSRHATPACDEGVAGTDPRCWEQGFAELDSLDLPLDSLDLPMDQASVVSSEIYHPRLERSEFDDLSHCSEFFMAPKLSDDDLGFSSGDFPEENGEDDFDSVAAPSGAFPDENGEDEFDNVAAQVSH